ncbi:MAG: hypothetical protein V1850_00275 [Candidatus Bathyarchaeota archaeon]
MEDESALADLVEKVAFKYGAYAAGQNGLSTVLIVGFALHNGNEGIAVSETYL